MSYRIETNLINKSQTTAPSPTPIGATSGIFPKGKDGVAIRFEKGEERKILGTLGYPSSSFPAVQDVIDYNKKGAILVSAPKGTGALYGGVIVTTSGTIPLASGLPTKEVDFAQIDQEQGLGTGDGTEVTFTTTLENIDLYKHQSVDVEVGGVSIALDATDADPEVLSNVGGDAGTLDRTTGDLSITFASAPASEVEIKVTYQLDVSSDAYMVLLSQSAQMDDLSVQLASPSASQFSISVYRKNNDGIDVQFSDSPYLVSLLPNGKDGFGRAIYAETVLGEDDLFLQAFVNENLSFSSFTDDSDLVALAGGTRGTVDTTDVVSGFDVFTDTNRYPNIKIVFSSIADATIASKFGTLRGNDASPGVLRYTKFLMPGADETYSSISSDFTAYKYNLNERGINVFAGNWGIHLDVYNGKNFLSSFMGLIAGRYLDSQVQSSGALSPSWIDENGVGGLLGASVVRLNQSFSQTELESLNAEGINGVFVHPTYGPMIEADKTTQINPLSDYSFTIHSDLADNMIQQIVDQVLPYQINKPIDDFHLGQVQLLADQIIGQFTAYLEEFVAVSDRRNNTDETRAQRIFVLTVGVKFTVNSQFIQFNFINGPQGLAIEQAIGLEG